MCIARLFTCIVFYYFYFYYFNKTIMHIKALCLNNNRDFIFIIYPFRTVSRMEGFEI